MKRARSLSALLCGLAVVTGVFPARGEGSRAAPTPKAEPPRRPEIVLPKLLEPAVAEYPQGAVGNGVVVLTLTLNTVGAVVLIEVESGDPPFRQAAEDAAYRFRFSPATRDGKAISSKIRFELVFKEPSAPATSGPATPEAQPNATSGPAEPQAPSGEGLEVDVLGKRTEPTVRSFSRAEVRELPGAFGDPFRAIEALPGVTPIFSGVPFFYVRGAPPGNVGYFLDGITVPLLYHVGLGPSVIHPGLVERVDLYPGAYPSRYGRFGGGIVAGETKAPEPEWRGEGNIRLFDSGALIEGPFAEGRGSALFAGRYSYTAAIISLFADNTRLEYWDYQGRLSYDLNRRQRVTLFSFGAFDYFGQEGTGSDEFFSTEFHRFDLRFDQKLTPKSDLRTAVTFGVDRTRGEAGEAYVVDEKIGLRSEYREQLSDTTLLRAGADATLDHYSVATGESTPSTRDAAPAPPNERDPNQVPPNDRGPDQVPPNQPTPIPPDDAQGRDQDSNDEFNASFPSRSDVAFGVHADLVWKAARGVTVTPGARVDMYSSDGAAAVALEPRVSAEYQITPRFSLTNALGVAHQPPSFVIPIPGFQVGGLRKGLQQSFQSSFGGLLKLEDEQELSLTGFHNVFFNMTDLLSLVRAEDQLDITFDTRTTGQAYGIEFLFKRDLSRRLGGFVSYTLSRSIRYTDIGPLAASFDRTHVFNAAIGYNLGRNWRGGGRFTFYTGSPSTGEFTFAAPTRLPAYYRLDVRLEKRWQLGLKSSVSFVFEVLNTTLNEEAVSQSCDPVNGCTTEYIGPVTIPSIGVEGAF